MQRSTSVLSLPRATLARIECLTIILAIILSLVAAGRLACAQSPSTPYGSARSMVGSSGLPTPPRSPILSGSENQGPRQHLGPIGKPCVAVNGEARAQTINPRIIEHVIVAKNSCSQIIKMQVCYFQSDRCIPMTLSSYASAEVVLGIMPAMKEFRYEYREEFN